MNTVIKLSLLAAAMTMAGCNEKVSPELESSSVTNPDVVVAPNQYYFNVTNTSASALGYKLHKTGAGNKSAACEVSSTTALSSDVFRGAPANNDISCYFDAEELALFHQGFKFSVNSSANTCDFIGYTPFGYYDSIPGDSSDTLTEVKCTNDTTDDANVATADTANGLVDLATSTTPAGCNQWVSGSIATGTRVAFNVTTDEDLCRFNYKVPNKEAMNFDIGVITVNSFQVTYTPADGATPAVLKHEIVPRTIKCGGKVANCIKGPMEILAKGKSGRFTEIAASTINQPLSVDYSYPALIGTYTSTRRYANYRRNLASTELDYGFSDPADAINYPIYKSIFSDPIYGKLFNPSVMDTYSYNRKHDGTRIIDSALLATYSYPNNQYKAVPLAADPFMGLTGATYNEVNPFYTFYCFDNAYDIKARIRMVVRDWDRVFPTTSDNEYISDIFNAANSRQDNPNYVELPDEYDHHIDFNDRMDWDDFINMERTPGVFDPTSTIWYPKPSGIYVDGFFNPAIFPQQNDLE